MEHISIKRIVECKNIKNAEALMKNRETQVTLCENSYMTVEEDGGYIILDFGKEMCGGIKIATINVKNERKCASIRVRFGESLTETSAELGEKNATNDHAPRDFMTFLSFMSTITVGNTGYRFVRIDFPAGAEITVKAILGTNQILKKRSKYAYRGEDKRIKEIFAAAKRTVDLCSSGDYIWDGVKRDRLVWIGDLYPEVLALTSMYGRVKAIESSLRFEREREKMDGIWMSTINTYNMWWVVCLAEYYFRVGEEVKPFVLTQIDYAEQLIALYDGYVDENGVITSKTKGETVITVTADSVTLDIPVTVYRGIEIAELEQNIVLLKGESKSFLSVEEYDVVLSEFYSSDENIASVNKNGTVTANSKGKTEIYTYNDDEKISTQVTVKQPVESASISSITLYTGESVSVKVSYKPTNADYGTNFTYKVADTSVASVNGNTVSAIKAGETVITAVSGNGISAQAKITVLNPPKATPEIKTISKDKYDSYKGEKYSDGSPYASYFKITFDHPVEKFRINYVEDDGTKKKAGDAIYKNAEVAADSPLYFAICINESDVLDTRGFYYTNKDGSKKYYSLHVSGRDGSVLMTEY